MQEASPRLPGSIRGIELHLLTGYGARLFFQLVFFLTSSCSANPGLRKQINKPCRRRECKFRFLWSGGLWRRGPLPSPVHWRTHAYTARQWWTRVASASLYLRCTWWWGLKLWNKEKRGAYGMELTKIGHCLRVMEIHRLKSSGICINKFIYTLEGG